MLREQASSTFIARLIGCSLPNAADAPPRSEGASSAERCASTGLPRVGIILSGYAPASSPLRVYLRRGTSWPGARTNSPGWMAPASALDPEERSPSPAPDRAARGSVTTTGAVVVAPLGGVPEHVDEAHPFAAFCPTGLVVHHPDSVSPCCGSTRQSGRAQAPGSSRSRLRGDRSLAVTAHPRRLPSSCPLRAAYSHSASMKGETKPVAGVDARGPQLTRATEALHSSLVVAAARSLKALHELVTLRLAFRSRPPIGVLDRFVELTIAPTGQLRSRRSKTARGVHLASWCSSAAPSPATPLPRHFVLLHQEGVRQSDGNLVLITKAPSVLRGSEPIVQKLLQGWHQPSKSGLHGAGSASAGWAPASPAWAGLRARCNAKNPDRTQGQRRWGKHTALVPRIIRCPLRTPGRLRQARYASSARRCRRSSRMRHHSFTVRTNLNPLPAPP